MHLSVEIDIYKLCSVHRKSAIDLKQSMSKSEREGSLWVAEKPVLHASYPLAVDNVIWEKNRNLLTT